MHEHSEQNQFSIKGPARNSVNEGDRLQHIYVYDYVIINTII